MDERGECFYILLSLFSFLGRMWAFSMGLFLISVSPESLHLSATYGLCMGAAVLVFGAIIGDWVDKTTRLKGIGNSGNLYHANSNATQVHAKIKVTFADINPPLGRNYRTSKDTENKGIEIKLLAATVSMILQNVLIAVCACVILTLIILLSVLADVQNWLRHLFYAIIISLSVSSRLMKEARIIIVERDWIVEMCAKDEHHLAVMTSSFRRLDLLTKLLAPVVTGQIMTFAGLKIGCGFVATWSLASLGVEYYLINRVYNIVPALKTSKSAACYEVTHDSAARDNTESSAYLITQNATNQTPPSSDQTGGSTVKTTTTETASNKSGSILMQMASSFIVLYRGLRTYFSCVTKWPGLALACLYLTVLGFDDITVGGSTVKTTTTETASNKSGSILMQMASSFIVLYRGLRTYFSCVTKWPGLALACLYLTVLGFDDITVGYATMLGFSGSVLGIMMGIGAGFGILATFTYPYIVKKLGLPKSGVLALGLQIACLTLCIVSVWLPDSPFDLSTGSRIENDNGTFLRCNHGLHNNTPQDFNTTSDDIICVGSKLHGDVPDSNISVWVLLAGIVLARFGLWTADLTTVQLFLENVAPKQRGIVNGFQSSLNQLMDFLKYALVVIIPNAHQFGLLVFISYACICLGWMFMCVNAVKMVKRTKISKGEEKHESIGI